jgi:branched-chain amino acid transport system substrate-binding protein
MTNMKKIALETLIPTQSRPKIKSTNKLAITCAVALMMVGCGNTNSNSTSTTSPATTNTTTTAASGNTVKIISSFPLTGSSVGQTQTIINGIKQALEEAKSSACDGKLKIDYESLDDATAASGKWDAGREAENANKAVGDPKVVAYIGTFNSGAAKIAIPILNQANLVMVSPANTAVGLTKAGGEPGEPDKYYPTGKRNYARVVPADDLQGLAGANWAKSLGAKKVFVLDDQEIYGKGLADVFEASVKKLGMQVLGHEGIDSKATDYKALMNKIKALNPDLIYFGGITQNNGGQLIKDMRNVGMTPDKVKFMGPDGIFEQALIDAAGKDAEGVYATFGGIPPKELTGAGKAWYEAYKKKFNSEPEAYAAYGYEAAKVVISGIDKACKNDRVAVKDAILATKDFQGILGTWSFDANGDTTLKDLSGNIVKSGKWTFAQKLEAK